MWGTETSTAGKYGGLILDNRVCLPVIDQASLFATDISACSAVDVNPASTGAENIFSGNVLRFSDGVFEDFASNSLDIDVSAFNAKHEISIPLVVDADLRE